MRHQTNGARDARSQVASKEVSNLMPRTRAGTMSGNQRGVPGNKRHEGKRSDETEVTLKNSSYRQAHEDRFDLPCL